MKWMFTFATLCILPLHRPRPAFDRLAGPFRSSDRLPGIHRRRQHVSELHADHRRTKNLRPTVAGMYNYIQPLVATLVAVCWGMETFDPTKICSVLLIFSGVYLVTTSRSRADAEKSRLQPESPGNDNRIPHAAHAAPRKRRRFPEISAASVRNMPRRPSRTPIANEKSALFEANSYCIFRNNEYL